MADTVQKTDNPTIELQRSLAAHIRNPKQQPAPEHLEPRRLKIYRDLIYRNVESFISGAFPVLHSLYEEGDWHQMIQDFLDHHVCHTPYFLEISEEFLAFLQNERNHPSDPPFLLELAHYEWVELALDVMDETLPAVDANADLLAGKPVVSPLAMSLAYQYPVHQIGQGFQPHEPPEQPTYLVVYRNREEKVQFMEVNGVTARLLALLQEQNCSGEAALHQIVDELQHPDPQAVIAFGRDILQQLQQAGIILGCVTP